jgi:hypothetical protein
MNHFKERRFTEMSWSKSLTQKFLTWTFVTQIDCNLYLQVLNVKLADRCKIGKFSFEISKQEYTFMSSCVCDSQAASVNMRFGHFNHLWSDFCCYVAFYVLWEHFMFN